MADMFLVNGHWYSAADAARVVASWVTIIVAFYIIMLVGIIIVRLPDFIAAWRGHPAPPRNVRR